MNTLAIGKNERLPLLPAKVASGMPDELERNLFPVQCYGRTFWESISNSMSLVFPILVLDMQSVHLLFEEPGCVRSGEDANVGH